MVYVFMPRSNGYRTWRNNRMAGATSYDSDDPDLWNCRRSASKKTYDYNATRLYDKPEKILKSPELKKRKYV